MEYAEFKKVVKALKVVIEASDAKEVQEEFKVRVSFLLKGYIEGFENWLRETDKRIQEVFNRYLGVAVSEQGQQDRFSRNLEIVIGNSIRTWVSLEEHTRKEYVKLSLLKAKKVKSVNALKDLDECMGEVEKDITDLARQAREYGEQWSRQIDDAGINLKDPIVRNTIDFFRDKISFESIKSDFERELRKALRKR